MTAGLVVIIALIGVAFLMLYLLLNLEPKKHFILQIILLFFVVNFIVLIAKTSIDYDNNCDIVLMNQTLNSSTDVTIFEYDEFCSTNTTTTTSTFYQHITWFLRIFVIYVFIYFFREVFMRFRMRKKS